MRGASPCRSRNRAKLTCVSLSRKVVPQHGQIVQIEQRTARPYRGREGGSDFRRWHRCVRLSGQDRACMETDRVGTRSANDSSSPRRENSQCPILSRSLLLHHLRFLLTSMTFVVVRKTHFFFCAQGYTPI